MVATATFQQPYIPVMIFFSDLAREEHDIKCLFFNVGDMGSAFVQIRLPLHAFTFIVTQLLAIKTLHLGFVCLVSSPPL